MAPRSVPILALLLLIAQPASAQVRSGMSDVLILVQPVGSQSLLAATFAKPTPHARVKGLLSDLAMRGGWKLGPVEVKDEQVPADFSDPSKLTTQTGASSMLTGAPIRKNGGFRLQPFVEAFSDYSKLEVLFIENADPSFAGLQKFQSPAVTVDLIKAGAPYRFMIAIDKNAGPIPELPLLQPAQTSAPTQSDRQDRGDGRGNSMAFVLFVSAASGLAVFFGLLFVTHLRSRRAVKMHYRGTSRP